jgi:hypothetical protein
LESGFGTVSPSINWVFPLPVIQPILYLQLALEGQAGKAWEFLNKPALFREIRTIGVKVFLTLFEELLNFNISRVSTNSLKIDVGSTELDAICK